MAGSKECIAGIFHRDTDEICVGNGSIELIRVFCAVALSAKKSCFIPSPTFGEYELSARLAGAVPVNNPKNATVSFACNPNNPTGKLNSRAEMMTCLQDVPSAGGSSLLTRLSSSLVILYKPLSTNAPNRSLSCVPSPKVLLFRGYDSGTVLGIRS